MILLDSCIVLDLLCFSSTCKGAVEKDPSVLPKADVRIHVREQFASGALHACRSRRPGQSAVMGRLHQVPRSSQILAHKSYFLQRHLLPQTLTVTPRFASASTLSWRPLLFLTAPKYTDRHSSNGKMNGFSRLKTSFISFLSAHLGDDSS